ncbi:GAF domain-containing protein [Pseudarthrobacter sp. N5]|uniref:GAF domain-containing sensor histidine kinase n=1 Tax=Pseudarthrobacter sp. N5 TaxID=3418416 RepID=UPI003CF3716F
MEGPVPGSDPGERPLTAGIRIEDLLKDFVARAGELVHAQERMRGLLEAVVAVAEDLSLEAVLDRVVRSACQLLNARYGALGVLGEERSLSHFITVGIDVETAGRIGPLPTGHGVLGLLISDPAPLRLHELRRHPKSYGFPEHHPPMDSFIGVPVRVRDVVFGNLYLTEKEGGGDFTAEDEDLAVALAAAAGVAIENARLYEDARRRAQWLEACMDVTGRMRGEEQEGQRQDGGLDLIAARALQESESDLALILVPDGGTGSFRVIGAAGEHGAHYAGRVLAMDVPEVRAILATGKAALLDDATECLASAEGLAWGRLLAIDLSALGTHHGLLMLARNPGAAAFSRTDVDMGSVFGSHVALSRELARAHRMREQLVVFTDRDRIARDLHDVVIQRLFAAGLSIQSLRRFTTDESAMDRIEAVTGELDETIRDLRDTIYSLRATSGEKELLSSRVLQSVRSASMTLPFAPRLTMTGHIDSVSDAGMVSNLLAVVSEGLSNAIRHSGADSIAVSVAAADGRVTLLIQDNGMGFSDPVPGNGLANMKHRARDLEGSFTVESSPAAGTTLVWSVPLN